MCAHVCACVWCVNIHVFVGVQFFLFSVGLSENIFTFWIISTIQSKNQGLNLGSQIFCLVLYTELQSPPHLRFWVSFIGAYWVGETGWPMGPGCLSIFTCVALTAVWCTITLRLVCIMGSVHQIRIPKPTEQAISSALEFIRVISLGKISLAKD